MKNKIKGKYFVEKKKRFSIESAWHKSFSNALTSSVLRFLRTKRENKNQDILNSHVRAKMDVCIFRRCDHRSQLIDNVVAKCERDNRQR